ncbi:MAG: MotA/TolQ/ExbB proton channel family protein [Campylobacterales bacterium]
MANAFIGWFDSGSTVALVVTVWLFFYAVAIAWIFLYRYFFLKAWLKRETDSAQSLLSGDDQMDTQSALYPCARKGLNPPLMKACYDSAVKESTSGLTTLSAIASTSPFVGLFGTVVGVLQAFAGFKEGVTLSIIAPAISEALVVTAMGIVVAVPAYWAHLVLKRKAYEVANALKIQIDIAAARA